MASPGKKAFALRIDPALWAEVERLAAAELRSANAQAELLLREALRARLGDAALRRVLAAGAARPAATDARAPDDPAPGEG
ncbi:hypothetical protein AACH10_06880 [Ideonella sp. DXS22W]|uniref:Toxin-antitoxin system HicB family antitoxin n=1 Tax=Pseudaquabacterium inlustre TaxID=2984192 RepID=A0ABU9CE45_9BURK